MRTIIKVQCIDQQLTLVEEPVLASGGVNEDIIQFTFCDLWDNTAKTAVFWHEKRPKEVFHNLINTDNECVIPFEVLKVKGRFFFGVVGIKDEIRRTSTTLAFDLKQGVGEEGILSAPTQSIYEQLLADYAECMETMADAVAEIHDTTEEAKNAAENAAADAVAAAKVELDAAVAAARAAQKAAEEAAASMNGAFSGALKVGAADTSGYYARNFKFSETAETPSVEGDVCFKLK